jgi:hypothetical protein
MTAWMCWIVLFCSVCLMAMRLSPRLLAQARTIWLALGITAQAAIPLEVAIAQLDASGVITVCGLAVALVREYHLHCANPQFAHYPVRTAGVLEHYVNSRTRGLADGKLDIKGRVRRATSVDRRRRLPSVRPERHRVCRFFLFSAGGASAAHGLTRQG